MHSLQVLKDKFCIFAAMCKMPFIFSEYSWLPIYNSCTQI